MSPPNARSLPRGRPVQPGSIGAQNTVRPVVSVKSAVSSPPALALVEPQTFAEQVADLVFKRVAELLSDPAQGERLLDDAGLRQALQCSQPTLRGLLEAKLPHVKVGEMRRYRLSTVLAWLEARGSQKAAG